MTYCRPQVIVSEWLDMGMKLLKIDPLYEGVLLNRIGRFVVSVKMGSEIVLAHNTNTGRLLDILVPGRRVLLSRTESRIKYRLVGVEDVIRECFNVVDVRTQARAFEESIKLGLLPYFRECYIVKRNPSVGRSRLDYLLRCGSSDVFVETKSAVMRGPRGEAMYPDCETSRGRRHIAVLAELASSGIASYLVFVSAVCSAKCFRPNEGGDKEIPRLLHEAMGRGVIVKSISIYMNDSGEVFLSDPDVPLCLGDDLQL
ncbi:MAG: DNA/RNA nuclease SfsA [Sulfolobales archaeon]